MIDVANEELEGWPLEGGVPGLITDLVLSLDDRDLFFSNWLHGDLRHYDVSDPTQPGAALAGVARRPARPDGGHPKAPEPLNGGPQMLQNSLDGEPGVRHQLAVLDLGQPVLPRASRDG